MERNASEELWRRDKGEAKDSWVGVRERVFENGSRCRTKEACGAAAGQETWTEA